MKKPVLTSIIILFLTILAITSCTKDDGNNSRTPSEEISAPEISNTIEPFEATFFTSGSLPVLPEVNWNGEEGSFSLDSESDEITVNSETGEISWTEKLPVGENTVTLIAENSGGTDEELVIISNKLIGVFEGNYNLDVTSGDLSNEIEFAFNENSLEALDGDFPAEGEFSVFDINTVTGNYIYLGYGYEVQFNGVLYYPEEGYPYIEGTQYVVNNPEEVGNLLITYNPNPEEDTEEDNESDYEMEVIGNKKVPVSGSAYNIRMFNIGNDLYAIDGNNNAMFRYDIVGTDEWVQVENFPGSNKPGIVFATNEYAYVSSFASSTGSGFWKYNPTNDEWLPMSDLILPSPELYAHNYNGNWYVPTLNGIFAFNEQTEDWSNVYGENAGLTNMGTTFLINSTLYWHNHLNVSSSSDFTYSYNIETDAYVIYDRISGVGGALSDFNTFTLGNKAYDLKTISVYTFDGNSNEWMLENSTLPYYISPIGYAVIGDTVYLLNNEEELVSFKLKV